jgi:uncharacterized repeat protein (TIGR03847 family)
MDLGPVDRITADAIGEPGSRVFYLQARRGDQAMTVIVEKEQVQLLSASILELLADLQLETGPGPDASELALEEPLEPGWRAGKLSIGFDEDHDLFVLEVEEFQPDADAEDAPPTLEAEPQRLRLMATREQMFALSRQGAAAAERGRPTCQFCGNPIDPDGHACPAMNGHASRD